MNTLINTTKLFEDTIKNLLEQTNPNTDHVWLKSVGKMVLSKMNTATILQDINCFKKHIKNGNILDFGTGSGYNSLLLVEEGYSVTAIDIDNYRAYQQNEYNKLMTKDQIKLWELLEAMYNKLSFSHYETRIPHGDNTFDAVFAYAVIEHIPDTILTNTLAEIHRVLKPKGVFFVSRLPRKLSCSEFITRSLKIPSHERLYGDAEAVKVLRNAGFEIVSRSFVEMLPAYPELWGQYKRAIFEKLDFDFEKGKKVLDIGCGPGEDIIVFRDVFGLDTYGLDVREWDELKKLGIKNFKLGSIFELPYKENSFDYVFLHDVMHHIDENNQNRDEHIRALLELKRVTKNGGYIVMVEGNRYNPLFYPHMVKALGHDHFTQRYFKSIISEIFPDFKFKAYETHYYPAKWLRFWKIYEYLMDKFSPKQFLAYNTAIINVEK